MKSILGIASVCFAIHCLCSCQSKEQKSDDAFEQVKEQKREIVDSVLQSRQTSSQVKPAEIAKKPDVADAWTRFRGDMEGKIQSNEAKIKALKGSKETSTKAFRRIVRLEKANNDFRKQMDDYAKDEKTRQEKFRVSLAADVKEIEVSLKETETITLKKG
ncbi:MAG: hypothetical protein ACHQRM_03770 [Bacteroidia bacterium]